MLLLLLTLVQLLLLQMFLEWLLWLWRPWPRRTLMWWPPFLGSIAAPSPTPSSTQRAVCLHGLPALGD